MQVINGQNASSNTSHKRVIKFLFNISIIREEPKEIERGRAETQ